MSVDLWDVQDIFQVKKGPSCYTISDIIKLISEKNASRAALPLYAHLRSSLSTFQGYAQI